jgi:lipoyl(octanoyl) transferase
MIIRYFESLQDYQTIWQSMQDFCKQRTTDTEDECWFLEHQPVFTLGQAGKQEHILNLHDIPLVQSDRGGQITYHGPGQLMLYCLWDIKRKKLNSRQLVETVENSLITQLASYELSAKANRENPGIYIDEKKIASIGFRITKEGYSYHGVAINIDNDLMPFSYIHPCGIKNQTMTSLQAEGIKMSCKKFAEDFIRL